MSSFGAWGELRSKAAYFRERREARRLGVIGRPVRDPGQLAAMNQALVEYAAARRLTLRSLQGAERLDPSIYDFAEWLFRDSGLIVPGALEDLELLLGELLLLGRRGAGRCPVKGDPSVHEIPWWLAELAGERLERTRPGFPGLLAAAEAGGFEAADLDHVFPAWRSAEKIFERMLELETGARLKPPSGDRRST